MYWISGLLVRPCNEMGGHNANTKARRLSVVQSGRQGQRHIWISVGQAESLSLPSFSGIIRLTLGFGHICIHNIGSSALKECTATEQAPKVCAP